jgi:hypothetical protein
MIEEISANEATGSSGLAANDFRRAKSAERWSCPHTWQKSATWGSSARHRGHSNLDLLELPVDEQTWRRQASVFSALTRP